jgi:hypothetical protein
MKITVNYTDYDVEVSCDADERGPWWELKTTMHGSEFDVHEETFAEAMETLVYEIYMATRTP